MKQSAPSHSRRETARIERGLEQLRGEVADLAADVRGLHAALDLALRRDDSVPSEVVDDGLEYLLPPSFEERDGLVVRALRRLKRLGLGAVRRLRSATDPGQEHLRWLEFVHDERGAEFTEVGNTTPIRCDGRAVPPTDLADDVAFLFSRLPLSAVWSGGLDGLTAFSARRGAADPFGAEEPLSETVVGVDLDGGPWPDGARTLLRRDPSDPERWRSGPWRVRAAPSVRRVPVAVRRAPHSGAAPSSTVVALLGEGLEGGLEHRVLPAVEMLVARGVPVSVVAAAAMSAAGEARCAALSRLGASVCRLERVIPPQLRADRLAELSAGVGRCWVIGGGSRLATAVTTFRSAARDDALVVAEPGACDVVIDHADQVLAPWPLVLAEPMEISDHGEATAPTVLMAGDWVTTARPEDAVFLARELDGAADIHLLGDGPQGATVRDLAEILGLSHRVRVVSETAAVSIRRPACVAWLGEGPWVPPAVASAMAAGLPVVVPKVGVLPELAALHPDGVVVGGEPGDVGAAAAAIRRAMAWRLADSQPDGCRLESVIDAARAELLEALGS